MKKAAFLLSILSLSAGIMASDCPDFSGNYRQEVDSCTGSGYKDSRGWPLQEKMETSVAIVQDGCESMTISYIDPRYTKPFVVTEKIDLKEAQLSTDKSGGFKVKIFEKASRVSAMGNTLKASMTNRLYILQTEEGLQIKSSTLMRGFYNYVVPVLDKDRFVCNLSKI